ncbi:MAG: hypothetical protein HY816_21490 [Candidatus Wallbacteria bacterium]|nr:hypothetical protein [Candidatus Wallbacteria bacterium]
MPIRLACFAILLALTGLALVACGDSSPGLLPAQPERSGNTEAVSFVQDEVLVTYRQTRVNEFQKTTLVWNGSVRNLGNRVSNARFEVLSTRGPVMRGQLQTKVEVAQAFGDLLPGQEQLIHATFSFPNTHSLAVSARFARDP